MAVDGWDVFLPFGDINDLGQAMQNMEWDGFFGYLAGRGYVRSWPCKDIEGNKLDPTEPEDYQRLDAGDVRTLLRILNGKVVSGADVGE